MAVEFKSGLDAEALAHRALERGLILLQSGENGCVVSITPPLSIDTKALTYAIETLIEIIGEVEEMRST